MGIYRGPGGTGDAVNDAASEALITVQAKDAALAAQAAAEAAQAAAELAETNAETAETNAETAETNAETAATNAASSASAASTSASNAASSASAASTSASNASTSASNAASSASAASTSASNASTSATNAANSATSASNSASTATTQATNASNSASAAATSATNAANSATAAQTAQTAAELAETNAETAEANAETAETNAAASASAAATSATNASNSASAASTSATNASNSASAAATSATNASNSASAAATSASNAATSESNAASSATAAAASYDSFDDRYLGAKSSAPTLDNDGNALLTGALYFNTTTNEMKVWSGSAWLNAYASLSGALLATNNLSDLNNTATARDNLGVEIGVDVQAYDAQLADIAGLTPADNNFIVGNGTNFVTESGSTARTSLGLGSIATQDANNVAVTGGSINGTTVGASTPSTGSFTSLTDSGNLTFTGTGNRITGDFSNGTQSNRVMFQTSTSNGASVIGVLPNGTGTTSVFRAFNNSDPTNAGEISLFASSSGMSVISGITGTGTYQPLTFLTGGSERLRIDTSGNVGIGTSSPQSWGTGIPTLEFKGTSGAQPTRSGALAFDSQSGSGGYNVLSSIAGSFIFFSGATDRASAAERMRIDSSGNLGIGTSSPSARLDSRGNALFGANARIQLTESAGDAVIGGTAGTNFTAFTVNNTERMRIDANGNVGIGTSSPATKFHVANTSGAVQVRASSDTDVSFSATATGADSTAFMTVLNDARQWTMRVNGAESDQFQIRDSTAGANRMVIDSSGNVQLSTANTSILNSSGRKILNQTGSILQVISTTKTDTFSTTSTSFTDITGLSVTITPSSTSSRIVVFCDTTITAGGGSGGFYGVRLVRGSTAINVGDASGSRLQASYGSRTQSDDNMTKTGSFNFVDSPATTSATTYKLQGIIYSGGTLYINRQFTDSDSSGYGRFASTITVMEIAG